VDGFSLCLYFAIGERRCALVKKWRIDIMKNRGK